MAFPFTIIPAYQELYDAVTSNGKQYEDAKLNDCLVGLYNSFFTFGMIVGPLASSYIVLATDFRLCTDAEAILLLTFFFVYLCVVFIPLKLKKKAKPLSPVRRHQSEQVHSKKLLLKDAKSEEGSL